MARDRLAAMRAQQQGGNVGSNSYPTQASGGGGGGGGYQSRRAANPYAQQDDRAYEMSDVRDNAPSYPPPMNNSNGGDSMSSFYTEISSLQDSIRTFNDNVQRIGDLHSRSLNNTDDNAAQRNAAALDDLVEETSALSATLKRRIKALEKQGGAGRDGQIRKQQTALVKSKFVEAIQAYQTVEQQYRTKYKQRMERQFKIVKPDATPDEVRAVVNDDSGGQIFSQALLNSNRYGESRAAYREVQERHEDIKRIERTLGELAQLFNDMSVLVEQQEETINVIETQAAAVEKDTEVGLQYTEKAVESARGARRKRWICFWISLIIIIIIVVVVVLVLIGSHCLAVGKTKKNHWGHADQLAAYASLHLNLEPPPTSSSPPYPPSRPQPRCRPRSVANSTPRPTMLSSSAPPPPSALSESVLCAEGSSVETTVCPSTINVRSSQTAGNRHSTATRLV
ncbi:Aspartate aminotransferase [Mycena chlorophos]|uniref:Aspartate aminotransferase n=1 Tax=Mycena chlorophos TaxID=658473 RepID=A0A8H6WLC6_MYCCL|nr:Aspartate aminotransferase [Mycena chlorophos]